MGDQRRFALPRAAKLLLQEIGTGALEAPLAPGDWRLPFAYNAVLHRPDRFEVLETFDPATLRETMRALDVSGPEDAASRFADGGAEPNALWRAWMETVHAVRLQRG